MTTIQKLEKISLAVAHAVVDVRSWWGTLTINLNEEKPKKYKIQKLRNEAQKIEDFARQLGEALDIRLRWVAEAEANGGKLLPEKDEVAV